MASRDHRNDAGEVPSADGATPSDDFVSNKRNTRVFEYSHDARTDSMDLTNTGRRG